MRLQVGCNSHHTESSRQQYFLGTEMLQQDAVEPVLWGPWGVRRDCTEREARTALQPWMDDRGFVVRRLQAPLLLLLPFIFLPFSWFLPPSSR